MDREKEIEAFESWVTNEFKHPEMIKKNEFGVYAAMSTYLYWQAWSARSQIEDSRNMQAWQKKG